MEKPWGYPGEYCPTGGSKAKNTQEVFLKHLQPIHVHLRVYFSFVAIIISKGQEILSLKSWSTKQQLSFLVEGWAVCRISRNQFIHPLPKTCQKLSCTETGTAQPPKQVQGYPMWHMKDKRQTYFFWIFVILKFLFKCWRVFKWTKIFVLKKFQRLSC